MKLVIKITPGRDLCVIPAKMVQSKYIQSVSDMDPTGFNCEIQKKYTGSSLIFQICRQVKFVIIS